MTVIGICGDSGSGKSTLSHVLKTYIHDTYVLECDRYHKWERGHENWKKMTHLNPAANHIDMMKSDIATLRSGHPIYVVDYDHHSGTFTGKQSIRPTTNLIVAGLHALHSDDLDLKIFMDTESSLKRHWKVNRDVKERGYDIAKVLETIKRREADYIRYILPQRDKADLIVRFFNKSLLVSFNERIKLLDVQEALHYHKVNYSLAFDHDRITLTFAEYQTLTGPHNSFYDHVTLCVLNGLTA